MALGTHPTYPRIHTPQAAQAGGSAMSCPEGHIPYDSEMLASNTVTLHQLRNPECSGTFGYFSCGDHFHVGHNDWQAGQRCKTSEVNQGQWARIRGAHKQCGDPGEHAPHGWSPDDPRRPAEMAWYWCSPSPATKRGKRRNGR
jgi:hypothetical protein